MPIYLVMVLGEIMMLVIAIAVFEVIINSLVGSDILYLNWAGLSQVIFLLLFIQWMAFYVARSSREYLEYLLDLTYRPSEMKSEKADRYITDSYKAFSWHVNVIARITNIDTGWNFNRLLRQRAIERDIGREVDLKLIRRAMELRMAQVASRLPTREYWHPFKEYSEKYLQLLIAKDRPPMERINHLLNRYEAAAPSIKEAIKPKDGYRQRWFSGRRTLIEMLIQIIVIILGAVILYLMNQASGWNLG